MLTTRKLNLISRFLMTIKNPKDSLCGDLTEFCINNTEDKIIAMAARHMGMTTHEASRLMYSSKFTSDEKIDHYKMILKLIDSDLLDQSHVFDILIDNTAVINRMIRSNTVMSDIGDLIKYDTRSFKTMFKFYLGFETLGLDTRSFKYWDPNLGIIGNLGRLGHNERTLAKAALRQHLKHNLPRGFEKDILNNQYLMNHCEYRNIIADICTKENLTASKLLMRLVMPGLQSYRVVGNIILMGAYVDKWKKWFDGEETITMGDGQEFYFHRHNLQQVLKDSYRLGLFPNSMNDHPRKVYRDVMLALADKEYREFRRSLGGVSFPPLPEPLLRLSPSNWRLLDSPYSLAIEGKRMNHCVGGSTYVNKAREGNVYFRYDDGEHDAVTVELRLGSVFVKDSEMLEFSPHWKADDLHHYTIGQMKHRYNAEPSKALKRKILTELLDCGVGEGLVDDKHLRLLACAKRSSALRGLATYQWVPCKSINLTQINQRKASNEGFHMFGAWQWVPDLDITHLYPHQHGLIVQPRTEHIRFGDRRLMAGDFDGDQMNAYNQNDATWMHRMYGYQRYHVADLLMPESCPLSTERIEALFDEHGQAQIRLGEQITRVVSNIGNDLPAKLACRLLARRVRYGLMSLDEMLKMHLRLRVRGSKAFCMVVSTRSSHVVNYTLDPYVAYNVVVPAKKLDTPWSVLETIAGFQINYIDSISVQALLEPTPPTITPLFITNLLGGYNLNLNIIPR